MRMEAFGARWATTGSEKKAMASMEMADADLAPLSQVKISNKGVIIAMHIMAAGERSTGTNQAAAVQTRLPRKSVTQTPARNACRFLMGRASPLWIATHNALIMVGARSSLAD